MPVHLTMPLLVPPCSKQQALSAAGQWAQWSGPKTMTEFPHRPSTDYNVGSWLNKPAEPFGLRTIPGTIGSVAVVLTGDRDGRWLDDSFTVLSLFDGAVLLMGLHLVLHEFLDDHRSGPKPLRPKAVQAAARAWYSDTIETQAYRTQCGGYVCWIPEQGLACILLATNFVSDYREKSTVIRAVGAPWLSHHVSRIGFSAWLAIEHSLQEGLRLFEPFAEQKQAWPTTMYSRPAAWLALGISAGAGRLSGVPLSANQRTVRLTGQYGIPLYWPQAAGSGSWVFSVQEEFKGWEELPVTAALPVPYMVSYLLNTLTLLAFLEMLGAQLTITKMRDEDAGPQESTDVRYRDMADRERERCAQARRRFVSSERYLAELVGSCSRCPSPPRQSIVPRPLGIGWAQHRVRSGSTRSTRRDV
jgi:hypothetical protein